MFNLIVTGSMQDWDSKWIICSRGRFLEHTAGSISNQFLQLGPDEIEALKAIPSVFISEGGEETTGRIGKITQLRPKALEIGFTFKIDEEIPPISWGTLMSLAWDLDINGGEQSRTHWAIKDADLLATLRAEGKLPTDTKVEANTSPENIRPSRRALLDSAKDLSALSHSDFDRMLLEFGVEDLHAGREAGSLMARSNAVAEFALKNPDARTASDDLLWNAIADRAAEIRKMRYDPEVEWPPAPDAAAKAMGSLVALTEEPALMEPSKAMGSLIALTEEPALMEPSIADRPAARVFLVHGRDDGKKHEIARFMEQIGLQVTILHEQPNKGRTLISKFQEEAAEISYAVVIMTPDDEGGLRGGTSSPRARQNVVFELGFFIGKLGADRVCALVGQDVERPSDFESVVYIFLDQPGAWKVELARELRAAGMKIDPSKIL